MTRNDVGELILLGVIAMCVASLLITILGKRKQVGRGFEVKLAENPRPVLQKDDEESKR